MSDGIESIGDILKGVLAQKGLGEQLLKQEVLQAWPEVVGEAIAAVTRARAISGDALVVEVRSSAWLMELNFMRQDILTRLNEGRSAGRIERIAFVLAEKPEA